MLYDVRSFNAALKQFVYAVNPRFGSAGLSTNMIRAPFRLTIDINVDTAPARVVQQLDRWLRPGRAGREGPRATQADLARRF